MLSAQTTLRRRISRRLLPLYVATFFQGFVLWYAVEKLFMRSIGISDAGIGLAVAIYSGAMLLVETPSGILADRWSRKGVLILASLALIISSVGGGLSHGLLSFLVCSVFWGIFYALYTGTYDSIVYDTVVEQTGDGKLFDHYYGRVKVVDSLALILSSLAGGFIGNAFNLRLTFYLSAVIGIGAIAALLVFREPQLHKAGEYETVRNQVRSTFTAVLGNRLVLPLIGVLMLTAILQEIMFEFSQLWWLALAMPTATYGLANAFLLSGISLGGLSVRLFKTDKPVAAIIIGSVLTGGSLGLTLIHSRPLVVGLQTAVTAAIIGLQVVYSGLLHDKLSSNIRAGATSAVSTLSRICFIPVSLLFGYISRGSGVFRAGYISVGLALAAAALILAIALKRPNGAG